jgi:two-component system cell cycle response regulator DivK
VSLNILLVENDYLLAKGTAQLIQKFAGHRVHVTDVPEEVFQACETNAVDLVMLNVNLPSQPGREDTLVSAELSQQLKHNPGTAHIPIVLVTAFEMTRDRQALLDTFQADEFCPQPMTDYPSLLATIGQVLS